MAKDVAEETITSCMERIQELSEGYSSENIWNMDESGCCCCCCCCFFEALSDKGLIEKGKEAKGGKKSKQRFSIAFLSMHLGKRWMIQLSYGRVKNQVVSNV